MLIFENDPPQPTQPSLWARVKALVTRATPTPTTPAGDAHVQRWIAQHAERNDAAMPQATPPAPVGMVISNELLAAVSAPSTQPDAFGRALGQAFPRTPPAALPPGA